MTKNSDTNIDTLTDEFIDLITLIAKKKRIGKVEFAKNGLSEALNIVNQYGHDEETRSLIRAFELIATFSSTGCSDR